MSAPKLTEDTVKRIQKFDDDFILINYANPIWWGTRATSTPQ